LIKEKGNTRRLSEEGGYKSKKGRGGPRAVGKGGGGDKGLGKKGGVKKGVREREEKETRDDSGGGLEQCGKEAEGIKGQGRIRAG
jgi:hypothetical protein